MDNTSDTKSPTPDATDPALVAGLRDDFVTASDRLARLTADYEAMLSEHDTIQEDRDATAQLIAEVRAVVARAESALARAEAGGYGRCERCGSPIPEERLAALPDATTCVSCV